jgi:hypothetical protein
METTAMKRLLSIRALRRAALATALAALAAQAAAQSGSDNSQINTSDLIRQLIEARDKKDVHVEGGVAEVTVNRGGSGVHGNLESKIEIEIEIENEHVSSPGLKDDAVGRTKLVMLQGNLRTDALPGWTLWLSVANEHLKTGGLSGTSQANGNVITEFKPRWERARGPLNYGIELGLVTEGRYNMNELQIRPFLSYQVTDSCRAWGGLRFARKYLELNNNDPDYIYTRLEAGGACFLGSRTIAGINFEKQRGRSINDDGGVRDLSGNPWPLGEVSKDSSEIRIKPFIHHRFANSVGLTATLERNGTTEKARSDYFQYQDRWTKLMLFTEYPVRNDVIIYSELSFKKGDKRLAYSTVSPQSRFGFAKDFSYTSTGLYVGVNYLF